MTVFAPPHVLLAPMAGVSDLPFRLAAQGFGCGYSVSEMVAGEQLAQDRREALRRAAGAGRVSPLVIQLAGREASWLRRGAELAADAGADVIDINMGCPAKQVTQGLSGSALMRDPDHALSLIEAVVAGAGGVPVTLKMRLGWDDAQRNAAEIAARAEAAGVAMLVVHGRTRAQFFTGRADWGAIKAVVEAVRIPVIANGDIASAACARAALSASGAYGVMIGRAAQGRPWLPGAIDRALRLGGEANPPPASARFAALAEQYEESLSLYGTTLGVRVARKHLAWAIEAELIHWPADARKALRARLLRLEAPRLVREALAEAFGAHGLAVAA